MCGARGGGDGRGRSRRKRRSRYKRQQATLVLNVVFHFAFRIEMRALFANGVLYAFQAAVDQMLDVFAFTCVYDIFSLQQHRVKLSKNPLRYEQVQK